MLLNKRFEFNNKPHLKLKNEQIKSIKEFSDEVKNLKLNDYEKLSCLICNQDNFEIISEKDRYGFIIQLDCVKIVAIYSKHNIQMTINLSFFIQNIIIEFILILTISSKDLYLNTNLRHINFFLFTIT